MVLSVAPDFPEINTVTLDTTLEFARRLPVSRYRSWAYAEALMCLSAEEWRVVLCDDEDADFIRTWFVASFSVAVCVLPSQVKTSTSAWHMS